MRLTPWSRGTLGSFFRKLNLETKAGLASPEPWLLDLFGASPAASGVSVTPRTAMACAPVRCAVQAIAETVGQLPLMVYERGADGSKERAPHHSAYGLLHDNANDWTSSTQFIEQVTRDALLFPNGGFALINRNAEGQPVELLRLDPEVTPVSVGSAYGEPVYKITESGTPAREIPWRDMIHIPSPTLSGCSLIQDGREAIGLAIVMERYAARLFGRGARPSGMLAFKGHMTPETLAKAKAAWQAAHGGDNGGGTAVVPGDAEWTPLTLTSVDAQFLELRKFSIEEISRLFRVPPIFLSEYGRATWGNGEQMGQQFLTYCLMPWVKRWEGELRLKLFAPEERKRYFAEFLTDDLLRADFDTRMNGYQKAISARILNPNEARAAENRSPYAGGEKYENPAITVSEAA